MHRSVQQRPWMSRFAAIWLCAVLLMSLAGCGQGDTESTASGNEPTPDADATVGQLDVSATEDASVNEQDTGPNLCEFSDNPEVGDPGAACSTPEDCDSGFCVDTQDGKQCTKTCSECCPSGWRCEQAPGQDTVFVCLPKLTTLCLPCTTDDVCAGGATGALCVTYTDEDSGATARFCGGSCESPKDCPNGYDCLETKGTAGKGKQCVKSAGLCLCSPKAVATGAKGWCTRSNTFGVCEGVRVCTTDGLGECDALKPSAESCDGIDNDCNGQTDEGLTGQPCEVSNDAGTCSGTTTCEAGQSVCTAKAPEAERCDGLDNDCNGQTDEGCDDDGDGFCAEGAVISGLPTQCTQDKASCNQLAGLPPWCPKGIGDCLDSGTGAAAVNPMAQETCGNQLDDDCDGQTDSAADDAKPIGCVLHYVDVDNDGFGGMSSACLCAPSKGFPVTDNTDCDDGDKLINPQAKEICGNQKDDNCNNSENEVDAKDCLEFYEDLDGDGAGTSKSQCLCAPKASFKAKSAGDCDDTTKAIGPNAIEQCNQLDDNCNGATDEPDAKGCKTWYADSDGDQFGDQDKSACLCAASKPYTTLQGGDCNDASYVINPNFTEICFNNADDDCDGNTDEEDGKGCTDYYQDLDADGYGSKKVATKCLCDKGDVKGFTTTKGGDCDDSKSGAQSYPGSKEICDGKDNDCDGVVDQGCDSDGDGWCDKSKTVIGKPTSCPKGGGDCDDGNKSVYPGASEICDGKDNNCKGGVDEGCDDDGDGWCDSKLKLVGNPAVCFKGGGDCADTDPSTNPGAAEVCDDKDNNCKSGADEGCDDDGDDWCDIKMKVIGTPKVCPKGGGDCCDIDKQAQPKISDWFNTANKCGSWDYNCSGKAEKRWTVKANPGHKTSGLNWECFANPPGWKNSTPPECGVIASWVYDFTWNGNFTIPFVNACKKKEYKPQTQECH